MARGVARGDIWLHHFGAPDKRRPVLVLSRPVSIRALRTVLVAPITTAIRGIPTETLLSTDDGLKEACAANLDHVQVVAQADLRHYVATLRPEQMTDVCRALAIATGCDPG